MELSHGNINEALLKFVNDQGLVDEEKMELEFSNGMHTKIIEITQNIANNFDVVEAPINGDSECMDSKIQLKSMFPYLNEIAIQKVILIGIHFWSGE